MADRLLRKVKAGSASLSAVGDSFLSQLAGRAFASSPSDQIRIGACSTLLMLAYAEQSARLRAKQGGGIHPSLYAAFANWANARGVEAFQIASGEPVSVPAPIAVDLDALGQATIEKRGPLI